MSIFKRVEDVVSSYIEDFLDHSAKEPRPKRHGWIDEDLADAWNELNDFLRGPDGYGSPPPPHSPHYPPHYPPPDGIPGELRKDFAELGVPAGASLADCKAAYRRLIKKYHPDTSDEAGAARFMRVKAAYDRIVTWHTGSV